MNKKLNILPFTILRRFAGCVCCAISMLSISLLATSCADDGYVGNEDDLNGYPVAFTTNTGSVSTRAGETGQAAATLLGNKFIVYGTKVKSDDTVDPVFPGYEVDYESGTANTTTSNTADWEYVGKGSDTQYIKYWDFGAKSYTIAAYSLGEGATPADYAKVTKSVSDGSLESLTLKGTKDQLLKNYLTNKITKKPSEFTKHQIQLQFFNLAAKIRLGIYENLAGYSVKDVKFYTSDTEENSVNAPTLYASSNINPQGGTYTIAYDTSTGKIQPTFNIGTYGNEKTVAWTELKNYQTAENAEETGTIYLGRNSGEATITDYIEILPSGTSADLHLKVDYTLVSTDGNLTTNVKGTSAIVPAAFTQWQPNYAYTYLFKINNVNATLQPITFDAYAVTDEDGSTTTFATYSITTSQEGDISGGNLQYVANKAVNIAVIKGDGSTTSKVTLNNSTEYVRIIPQTSTDENVIETVYTNEIEKSAITYTDGIATFTPTAAGCYRIEYCYKASTTATVEKRAVKVVKVVAGS